MLVKLFVIFIEFIGKRKFEISGLKMVREFFNEFDRMFLGFKKEFE